MSVHSDLSPSTPWCGGCSFSQSQSCQHLFAGNIETFSLPLWCGWLSNFNRYHLLVLPKSFKSFCPSSHGVGGFPSPKVLSIIAIDCHPAARDYHPGESDTDMEPSEACSNFVLSFCSGRSDLCPSLLWPPWFTLSPRGVGDGGQEPSLGVPWF